MLVLCDDRALIKPLPCLEDLLSGRPQEPPYEGAKPRAVVMDRNGWHQLQVQMGLAQDDDMALAAELSEEEPDYEPEEDE